MLSAENTFCRKCCLQNVQKFGNSVENTLSEILCRKYFLQKRLSSERKCFLQKKLCGKCFLQKMHSVENAFCGKCFFCRKCFLGKILEKSFCRKYFLHKNTFCRKYFLQKILFVEHTFCRTGRLPTEDAFCKKDTFYRKYLLRVQMFCLGLVLLSPTCPSLNKPI